MKTVSHPIIVPHGKFCWDGTEICEHFDNEGGHPSCDLGFWEQRRSVDGSIYKPDECLKLQEIT